MKKILFSILFLFLISSTLIAGNKKTPPFLIQGKIPHMTKILINKWNDEKLALTKSQKEQLKAIRVSTLSAAQALSKKINKLENEIAQAVMNGVEPDKLYPKVDKVASLRAEATKIQLECVYKSNKILTKKQINYLLKSKPNKKKKN
jgi:Spy/CpxP family protein refolding chaperone